MKRINKIIIVALTAFILGSCASAPTTAAPEEPKQGVAAPQPEPAPEPAKDEYTRSTENVHVTKEVFEDDKSKVLHIIDNLDLYMKNYDYNGWYKYVDPESRQYWSMKGNLTKASSLLKKKGLRLLTLEDYFRFVFIPARTGHTVEEIRYVTEDLVKVVQVEDDTDIVYYTFKKTNDHWKLVLPKNPD